MRLKAKPQKAGPLPNRNRKSNWRMGSMSIAHWIIVIGIAVLLFGRHKVSGLMGDVAKGIRDFRNGLREDL